MEDHAHLTTWVSQESKRRFAAVARAHLREQGVAANATERAVRGQYAPRKKDAIFSAIRRRESTKHIPLTTSEGLQRSQDVTDCRARGTTCACASSSAQPESSTEAHCHPTRPRTTLPRAARRDTRKRMVQALTPHQWSAGRRSRRWLSAALRPLLDR